MQQEKNLQRWVTLGSILPLFCAPLGFYTAFISMKVSSSLRVGDLGRADEYVRKIKKCYKISGICWAIIIVLSIIASVVD